MKQDLKILRPIDLKRLLKDNKVPGVGSINVLGPKRDKNGVYVEIVDTKFYWDGNVIGNTLLWSHPDQFFSSYTLHFMSDEKYHNGIIITLLNKIKKIGFDIIITEKQSEKKHLCLICKIYMKLNYNDIKNALGVLLKREGYYGVDMDSIEPDGFNLILKGGGTEHDLNNILTKHLKLFIPYAFEVDCKIVDRDTPIRIAKIKLP